MFRKMTVYLSVNPAQFPVRIEKPEFSTVNQVILVITGVFAVIFIFSLFYVFALIARFDNTIFKTVKNAVMLAVFNLRETFLLTLIHVIVIVLMIFTKGIWIFMMVGGFSVCAYINSLLFIRVFRQYEKIEGGKADLQTIIKQTKSKILDLAIHGKLVPQDPNDEPAIELLKRINPDFTPCDNEHSRKLPQNWCICRLKDLCSFLSRGKSPKYSNN